MSSPSAGRDEFPEPVKRELAKRVGTLCSNPACCTPTYGPVPINNSVPILCQGVARFDAQPARG